MPKLPTHISTKYVPAGTEYIQPYTLYKITPTEYSHTSQLYIALLENNERSCVILDGCEHLQGASWDLHYLEEEE